MSDRARICIECLEPGARQGRRVCDHCQRRLRDARLEDRGYRAGWAACADFFGLRLEDWTASPEEGEWRPV